MTNALGNSSYTYTGTYTNLKAGSIAVVILDADLSVVDSNTNTGTSWLATVLRKSYSGTTLNFTRGPWTYGFKKYGYDAVGGAITASTYNLGAAGLADNVILGGLVNQVVNPKTTLAQAAAAALTALASLDNFFDASYNWSTASVANAKYPTVQTYFFADNGTIVDFTGRTVAIDSAAAAAVAVNTVTNLITAKATTLAKGAKFDTLQATAVSVAANTSVACNLIGTVTNAGTITGSVTGNLTNTGTINGATITGNVSQAVPTDLTSVTITGDVTFNTNTAITVTWSDVTVTGPVENLGTGTVTIKLAGTSSIGTVGANVTVTPPDATLTVSNIVAGSRLLVRNTATGAVLVNAIVTGTSYDYVYATAMAIPVLIRLRNATSAPFYQEFSQLAVLTAANSTVFANQVLDQ